MSKKKKSLPAQPAVRESVKRRFILLSILTFLPTILLYVMLFLVSEGFNLGMLAGAMVLGLIMIGYIGERILHVEISELSYAYLNFMALLIIGLFALGAGGNWLIVILVLSAIYLLVVAGVMLRKWMQS